MNPRHELAGAIGGQPVQPAVDAHGLVDAAIAEGVAALLAGSPAGATLPGSERDRLQEYVRADAVRLAALDAELARVLDALAADGLTPLLLKGVHLAHAVYPRPWLRTRSDTDLLIAPDERDRLAAVLDRCGYVPSVHVRGRIILGQFHFERVDPSGIAYYLDVHWRAAAPLLVERVLPARRLFEAANPLPALGPHARVPDPPHALLLACVHLAAHHRSNPLLLWLYDLRLLAEAAGAHEREAFVDLTRRHECCAIAAHALDTSRCLFESKALDDLAARVQARTPPCEISAALLRIRRPAGELWLDLRTAGWRERGLLLREHLLPDREYMSHRRGALPIAYAVRIAHGARRWLTGH